MFSSLEMRLRSRQGSPREYLLQVICHANLEQSVILAFHLGLSDLYPSNQTQQEKATEITKPFLQCMIN